MVDYIPSFLMKINESQNLDRERNKASRLVQHFGRRVIRQPIGSF